MQLFVQIFPNVQLRRHYWIFVANFIFVNLSEPRVSGNPSITPTVGPYGRSLTGWWWGTFREALPVIAFGSLVVKQTM